MTLNYNSFIFIRDHEGLDQPWRWPGESSGITIGRGFDLGYNTKESLRSAWGKYLDDPTLTKLGTAIGVRGEAAKILAPKYNGIVIRAEHADAVLRDHTLPAFERLTLRAFPGSDALPPDAFGALVSLTYNRGASCIGERRMEMAEIAGLTAIYSERVRLSPVPTDLQSRTLTAIADAIRRMKRLWPLNRGLRLRRDAEAKMVEGAISHGE